MIKMDFTTTAMARPEIVERTYASFSKNLKGIDLKECRLFINIDPLPSGKDRKEVTKVAKKYFREVIPNYPDKPNYTAAYNWLWSSAESNIIFNLEDDWELIEEVPIPELVDHFNNYPEMMEVALRAYTYEYPKCPTSPCLMGKKYYKAVGGKLNITLNPEIQLRGRKFGIEMPNPKDKIPFKGKLIVYPENKVILKDIGRSWLKRSNYRRPKKKARFTSWETKK